MKFTIYKCSEYYSSIWDDDDEQWHYHIMIDNLEELEKLSKEYNNERLIIDFKEKKIWIYDDWFE